MVGEGHQDQWSHTCGTSEDADGIKRRVGSLLVEEEEEEEQQLHGVRLVASCLLFCRVTFLAVSRGHVDCTTY